MATPPFRHGPYSGSSLTDHRVLVPLADLEHSLYRTLPTNMSLSLSDSPPQGESPASPKQNATDQQDSTQTPVNSTDNQSKQDTSPGHACQWIDCDKVLPDPETLYNHLCNDHIGRKSTGNLCLTCKWKDCGTSCAKRDHITSHLRVHTPLKPHVCEICKKPFKRPQDLKKHEKIHTEEHHAQHRHSKAITVSDPAYSSRVHGDHVRSGTLSSKVKPSSFSSDELQIPIARAKSGSISLSDGSSDLGLLPTPSPDIAHSPIRYSAPESHHPDLYSLPNQLPSWEVLRADGTTTTATSGGKRSYDAYGVDDFFTDVKKRRVNPSYDTHMVERLNSLAQSQSLSNATGRRVTVGPPHNFNPRSISFDIRSPEELAAVNDFLITLGRDVSNAPGAGRHPHPSHPTHGGHPVSHSHSSSLGAQNDFGNAASYFDTADLTSLGLAGMPGVPTNSSQGQPNVPGSGAGYHGDGIGLGSGYASAADLINPFPSRANHQSVQPASSVQYGVTETNSGHGLYPALPTESFTDYEFAAHNHGRRISLSPPGSSGSYGHPSHYLSPPPLMHPTPNAHPPTISLNDPSISLTSSSPLSSHSSLSTPPNATPPHIPSLPVLPAQLNFSNFDYVRQRPQGAVPPTIQLNPVDLGGRTMRNIVPLKTAPESGKRPEPVEPRLDVSGQVHRGPPAKLTSISASSSTARSSSPRSRPSTDSTASEARSSLYTHLLKGDDQYKLAPLKNAHLFKSPSPPPSVSMTPEPEVQSQYTRVRSPKDKFDEDDDLHMRSPSETGFDSDDEMRSTAATSRSVTPEAYPRRLVLPGIKSLTGEEDASSSSSKYPDIRELSHDLPRKVSRIALEGPSSPTPSATSSPTLTSRSPSVSNTPTPPTSRPRTSLPTSSASNSSTDLDLEEQRAEHAKFIRDLLIQINVDYKQRYGTPPPKAGAGEGLRRSLTPTPAKKDAISTGSSGSLYPSLSWEEKERDVEMVAV